MTSPQRDVFETRPKVVQALEQPILMGKVVTIHREDGFRVVIYVDDHGPAHVHVIGDGEAKINLLGSLGQPELIWAEGMKRSDVRRAVRLVNEHQDRFLLRWRYIHG